MEFLFFGAAGLITLVMAVLALMVPALLAVSLPLFANYPMKTQRLTVERLSDAAQELGLSPAGHGRTTWYGEVDGRRVLLRRVFATDGEYTELVVGNARELGRTRFSQLQRQHAQVLPVGVIGRGDPLLLALLDVRTRRRLRTLAGEGMLGIGLDTGEVRLMLTGLVQDTRTLGKLVEETVALWDRRQEENPLQALQAILEHDPSAAFRIAAAIELRDVDALTELATYTRAELSMREQALQLLFELQPPELVLALALRQEPHELRVRLLAHASRIGGPALEAALLAHAEALDVLHLSGRERAAEERLMLVCARRWGLGPQVPMALMRSPIPTTVRLAQATLGNEAVSELSGLVSLGLEDDLQGAVGLAERGEQRGGVENLNGQ